MKLKSLKIPMIMIAIGLVLSLVACLVLGVTQTPTITEHDFHFAITYRLDDETKTFEGIYTCRFDGFSEGSDPRERYYNGEYTVDGETTLSRTYTIAEKDGLELYIVTTFSDAYLMGDTKGMYYQSFLDDPYLEAMDAEGMQYGEEEIRDVFDAEILSWEYPAPIENTFVFSGFTVLHLGSMVAMLAIGLLVMVACLVFVKRDKTVPYKALDKISVVLNFVVTLAAIPFMVILVFFMQIVVSGSSFVYQVFLCVPALTMFTVAASAALRREGFTKTGFFIQFIGPILFAALVVLEPIL